MNIKFDTSCDQLAENINIQYLPAKIESDNEANIKDYFDNYTVNENGHLTNSLRGYPLDGIKFELPPNWKGVVLQESRGVQEENCDKFIKICGTFEHFTYWNYDKVPSAADHLRQALEVSAVADELSKPLSAKDIENEINCKNLDKLK